MNSSPLFASPPFFCFFSCCMIELMLHSEGHAILIRKLTLMAAPGALSSLYVSLYGPSVTLLLYMKMHLWRVEDKAVTLLDLWLKISFSISTQYLWQYCIYYMYLCFWWLYSSKLTFDTLASFQDFFHLEKLNWTAEECIVGSLKGSSGHLQFQWWHWCHLVQRRSRGRNGTLTVCLWLVARMCRQHILKSVHLWCLRSTIVNSLSWNGAFPWCRVTQP